MKFVGFTVFSAPTYAETSVVSRSYKICQSRTRFHDLTITITITIITTTTTTIIIIIIIIIVQVS